MKAKTRKRRVRIFLSVVVLLFAVFLARPLGHLITTAWNDVDQLENVPFGYTDDASRLNQVEIRQIWEIPIEDDNPEGQLAELLQRAKAEGLRISIAGTQHSMGGHTIYPGGIGINMLSWNRMELNEGRDILRVGAGAVWKDVIAYLDQYDRSVEIMQSNNSFSVGGSISVNCHGWQYDRPPIASSVLSFRLMRADGEMVFCSRDENEELFSLVLGGYGLFGIILDVELRVVPNEVYRLERHVVAVTEALETFNALVEVQPDLQMIYARMDVSADSFLNEVIINAFVHESDTEIPALAESGMVKLKRTIFRGSVSDYGKELRWNAETRLLPYLSDEVVSRNQLLNEGVEVFQNRSSATTDILHEYFVPVENAVGFVEAMRRIIPKNQGNLLNVTIRMVNEDPDTFLRYADRSMFAFVMLFVQEITAEGEQKMKELTEDLIDAAIEHHGRYYLPYRLHASLDQFYEAYPQAREFFRLKRKYDPEELFQNQFYLKYGTEQ